MFRRASRLKSVPLTKKHLSLVLTREPCSVDVVATLDAYKRRFPSATRIASSGEEKGIERIESIDNKMTALVAPMPAAVPNHEADLNSEYSLVAFRPGGFVLAPHTGHFAVVTSTYSLPIVESLKRHTLMVAAVADAHDAVGIYDGGAHATHETAFYLNAASDNLPLVIWTGISRAETPEGSSLLSLGMGQFDLPDLLIESPQGSPGEALALMFDVLGYIVQRGRPIGEGETVGRTADEKLPVRYVPSPVDPDKAVAWVQISRWTS